MAACGGAASPENEQSELFEEGVISGKATQSNDVLIIGALAGNVSTGSGDDNVLGGIADDIITLGSGNDVGVGGRGDDVIDGSSGVDIIRGGIGKDQMLGGAGKDNLILIGIKSFSSLYTIEDITNPNGTGIDLSSVISLNDVNHATISDVSIGEIIDGGADGVILFIYGNVDLTKVILKNVDVINLHSVLMLDQTILNSGIKEIVGDGSSSIELGSDFANDTDNEIDLSNVKLIDIGRLIINAEKMKLTLSKPNIENITKIVVLNSNMVDIYFEPAQNGSADIIDLTKVRFSDYASGYVNSGDADITLHVPKNTILKLSTLNYGKISKIEGEGRIVFDNDIRPGSIDLGKISDTIEWGQESAMPTGNVYYEGAATVGSSLTADTLLIRDKDIDGKIDFKYQWYRDGAAIDGATEKSYTLQYEDYNKLVNVNLTYTDIFKNIDLITGGSKNILASNNDYGGELTIMGANLRLWGRTYDFG